MKKIKKPKPTFKVYVTRFPNNEYYIGFSTKTGVAYDKYFGSNAEILKMVKEGNHGLVKETIAEYPKRSHAKAVEAILQWENRFDPLMRNQMWNVRLRLDHLTDLVIPDWKPSLRSLDQLELF